MGTWLVTGCNRGIGLELVRQLAGRGDTVIAACRSASDALSALDVEIVEGVDVSSAEGVAALAEAVGDRSIDVLVNNAGILARDSLDAIDYDAMLEQFNVNALGPLRVTEALLGNLAENAKIAIVTSRMGSIADNTSGSYFGYRVSKCAVNMVGATLARDLEARGISVVLLHPGMVATDMTGGNGIEPETSAHGLIARIDELSLLKTGSFWHAPEGFELPW